MDSWQIVLRIGTGVLRRRKRLLVLMFFLTLGGLLPAAHYLSKERPRYATAATIFVEMRPSGVPIFQELAPIRPLAVQLAILNSRSLAETVLESLPPESLQDLEHTIYDSPLDRLLARAYSFLGSAPKLLEPRAQLLAELTQRMKFVATADGIFTITAEASKPHIAVDVANTYVEVLLRRTRSFNQDDARVSREFLEQQLADVRKTLHAGEQRLQRVVAAHGGITVPERSRAAVEELALTERGLAEIETNRKMVETRLQALREKAETQKRTPVAARPAAPPPPPPAAPEVQRLREQLTRLEASLLDLRGRYTDQHPRVALTREQIADIRRELGDAVKERTAATPAPDAVPPVERVDFTRQVIALETAFHTLTAQEEALRNQAARLRQSLTGLSRDETDYARAVREVESARHLFTLLSDKLTASRIREQGEMRVVKIIDPAARAEPATGRKRMMFFLAALGGAVAVGAGVPAGVEWARRAVETEEDVAAATGLPVLTSVPRLRSRRPVFVNEVAGAGRRLNGDFVFTEAFHTLRVAVQFAIRSENIRSLLVTSPLAGEGKSTVVLSLAHAFREAGQTIVVTDTDFHRPTLHRTADNAPRTGFLDALHGQVEAVEESLVPVQDGMWLLPRGSNITPRMREALTTNRVKNVLDHLSTHAKLVVCDSSPVLLVPDGLFLASSVDAVLLVAKAGTTGFRELTRAKEALEGAGARVIGVVLNELPRSLLSHYANHYYTRTPRNGHET